MQGGLKDSGRSEAIEQSLSEVAAFWVLLVVKVQQDSNSGLSHQVSHEV